MSRLHAIALTDDADGLRLVTDADRLVATLPRAGANAALVSRWAQRLGLAVLPEAPAGDVPAGTLDAVPTVVIVPDPRVTALARSYATAVGAPLVEAGGPAAVSRAVADATDARSATVVLLNDAFDEPLVEAVRAGNAERVRRGHLALTSGIVTAFDAANLAWLLVKTLVCLDGHRLPTAAVGRFDGVSGAATLWSAEGAITPDDPGEPWTDPRAIAQSVVAHGVAYDLSLGRVVLCSHLDPPLPLARTAVAPSCFHDGVCFRLARPDGPEVRRRATEATPLVWGIDSCGAVPFKDNAFGNGSSYALALLAGSAVAVIGPYLTVSSSGLAARAFEALTENGWSTGEIGAALGAVDANTVGFSPYVVLGSPDLRVMPPPREPAVPAPPTAGAALPVHVMGRDTVAVDLADAGPALRDVVADDGSDAWRAARVRRVDAPGRAALVVAFDRPRHLDGHLRLGDTGPARRTVADRCDEIDRRLGVLAGYGFAAGDAEGVAAVRALVRETASVLRADHAARATTAGALLWTRAGDALAALEGLVARHFVAAVIEHDVSFDGESENGFVAGPLRRSGERCHGCAAALYVADDRWAAGPGYLRRKATCPNCFGVSLRLASSPLAPVGIACTREGGAFRVRLGLRGRDERPLRARVAAAPRRGRAADAAGPREVDIPGGTATGAAVDHELRFPASAGGVATYRILVLCEGAAELYTAVDPGGPTSASTSRRLVTAVGAAPEPGQARPDGLNHTG